jgi:hypothetical protein
MKKVLIILGLFIVLNISTAYIFLFTSFGNGFVSSLIEDKVNENKSMNFKFEEFILTMSQLDIQASIDENSYVKIMGEISPLSLKFDLDYEVDIQDLSKLEPLIAQKLNGSFRTNGEIKGNKDLLLVNGVSDVFQSNSKYDVVLKNFNITNIDLLFSALKIEELLYTLDQPLYATGLIDITGNITDINPQTLAGSITTDIYDGVVNSTIVNEAFELKLTPNKLFDGQIQTELEPMLVRNEVNLNSSFANVFAKELLFSLKNNSINSDYTVVVEDLNNLFDLTQMPMQGSLELVGDIKKDTNLLVTGQTNSLSGDVSFELLNDDFSALINQTEVVTLLNILKYPEFFDSKADATVTYNLKTQSGNIQAQLHDGQFLKNKFSTLVNNLARFDLTKEVYKSVELQSQINQHIIDSTLSMKSKLTQIDVTQSQLDLENNTHDAQIKLDIKGLEAFATLSGNTKNPNIKLDVNEALKQKVKDKIKEKITEKFGGRVEKKLTDENLEELKKSLKALL